MVPFALMVCNLLRYALGERQYLFLALGLKGRFSQPRPSRPGESAVGNNPRPDGAIRPCQLATEPPFQGEFHASSKFPGLRPGLTETACWAEKNRSRRCLHG